jgi:hypothetical protein
VVNVLDMAIQNRRPEPGIVQGTMGSSSPLGPSAIDPLCRAGAFIRRRRRRTRQRDDGRDLVIDADRAPQSPASEDRGRPRERDISNSSTTARGDTPPRLPRPNKELLNDERR